MLCSVLRTSALLCCLAASLPLCLSFSIPPSINLTPRSASRSNTFARPPVLPPRNQQRFNRRTPLHQAQPDAPEQELTDEGGAPSQGFPPPWLLPFLVPALGGGLFGFDIGSSSAVVRILSENTADFGKLGALELGQVASGSLLGAMGMSALLIFVGDKVLGRRQELRLASLAYASG
eukprot:CAMPEP_0181331264 /NCGR_PEP_ID=MMETSP1101-20121128/24401_1 /TAXON_ID=46948 /ORGANISM="Rhodomonas abbreviata, Strain Caron Lab Isolate" /LENGTH=176 /DNA_ID=CAMNT_0023440697 /DNA_START=33 /DNA_END=559 /DNA_ORIENTATION=+